MMDDQTLLDLAWAQAEADPDDIPARMRYYARLTEGELFLLLDRDPVGDDIAPRVFDLEDGPIVLAFDTEDRLTTFTGIAAPYAALPGRALVEMLAHSSPRLGLGVNLGVAPSSRLLPPEILDWLVGILAQAPVADEARVSEFLPPRGLPEMLLTALDARLARMQGLARMAWLAGVRYDSGAQGHILAFIDAVPGADGALSRAVQSALALSGVEAGQLDVTFLPATDLRAARIAKVGLRFDLPQPPAPEDPAVPGMDPARPPRLR